MAAFIAKRVKLARVILSSSPWDHASPSGRLAPWLAKQSATPLDRWFGVYHAKEHMAAKLARACAALGLSESHIRVVDIVPNPPPHPKLDRYHGSEWGATVPVDAEWRPRWPAPGRSCWGIRSNVARPELDSARPGRAGPMP
jgi:hypothetical protein